MLKLIIMLKKRADISNTEFKRHYEERHAPLGLSLMPSARRYVRRYLASRGSKIAPIVDDAFDVIAEVWFESQEDYDRTMAAIKTSPDAALLVDDEFKLFDREATRYYVVADECESVVL